MASCPAVAEHVRGLLDRAGRGPQAAGVRDVFARRCSADAWSDEIRGCVLATATLADPRHCKAKLPPPARARLELELVAAAEAARAAQVPPECQDYGRVMERMATCQAMPQAARDAMRDSFEATRATWTKVDPASRGELETACSAAAAALRQAAASVGCELRP